MPTPIDQLPPDMKTLARQVADLRREVNELRAARRLEAATVGAGGLNIAKGGRLAMTTPASRRMVDIGAIDDDNFNNPDGTHQQGQLLRRQDGSLAFSVFASQGSGVNQFAALWDASGNIILSDDAASGSGLARPYLPVPMWPAFDAGWDYWPRTSGTSMVELWGGQFYRQQPQLAVVIKASMDTAGAAGQVQLTVGGLAIGSPQSVGFGVGYFTFGPVDLTSYGHMQQLAVAVIAKRVSGSGAIRAAVYSAFTLQS